MDKIDSNKTREKAPPFLRYAALHLVDHMRRSKPEAIDFNTPLFEPKSKIRKNWFQSIYKIASGGDSRDAPTTNSRLHIAAYFNLLNFAQHISKESGFSTRLGRGNSHLITPLFVAAAGGNVDVFKFLLDQGAPRILYGENILTFASRLGQIKIVELLLEHTSLVNETVNENITQKGIRAFFRFAPNSLKNRMLNRGEQAHLDFEELCTQDFGGGISALQAAVFGGHKEIVELLVDNKAKLDHVSSEGWSVAHFAVWAGRPDVLELVQLRGVDLKVVTKKQWTALHFAALRGHTAVLPQLVESGLELDASNDQNETPLHLAADHGHAKMVEALIERGANIEAVTSKGVTPLQIAVAENQEAVTEQLLKHGAKEDTSQTLNATKLPWVGGWEG